MSVPRRHFLTAAAASGAGLAAGYGLGSNRSQTAEQPEEQTSEEPTDVDIGFCTDMAAHHLQAIAMCQRVLGRDTGDPVQAAATEVLTTQAIEVGTMRAWLADWGESTSPPDVVMAWMGMMDGNGMPAENMPGLATEDEMRELSLAEGTVAGRMWIELMRAHHVGGVHMAEAAAATASVEKVRRLATVQVRVQSFEIEQYDVMLATDYA